MVSSLPRARPSAAPRGATHVPAASGNASAESDAKTLTALAEGSDDPRVVIATLEALATTYAARGTRKSKPDAELERVLVKHLASNDDAVVKAALATARVSLLGEQPQAAVVEAVTELTDPEHAVPRRTAALEALGFLRPDRRGARVLSAIEAGLAAEEPELLSLSLLALSQSRESLESAPDAMRTRLSERVLRLLGHGNPGVRGRALLVLAELPSLSSEDQRYDAGNHALLDREPYVHAQAADLLARSGRPAAIHRLIEGVRDLRTARYELAGYRRLDGTSSPLVHEVPGRRSVAEAVLFAIQRLAEARGGLEPLVVSLRDRHSTDVLVASNADRAIAWYARNREKIPRDRG